MTIGLGHYLSVGAILFTLGILGIFLNRKNILIILMSIELILLAVNINLVAFSNFLGDIVGQVFALLVLTVAAAETAIGLAVLVVYFRNRGSIEVEDGIAKVELLLTSGWCPFAATVLTQVKDQIRGAPGIRDADVSIVWDEAWTTDRLSPRARDILRFLPPPAAVPDRDSYIRAHLPAKE